MQLVRKHGRHTRKSVNRLTQTGNRQSETLTQACREEALWRSELRGPRLWPPQGRARASQVGERLLAKALLAKMCSWVLLLVGDPWSLKGMLGTQRKREDMIRDGGALKGLRKPRWMLGQWNDSQLTFRLHHYRRGKRDLVGCFYTHPALRGSNPIRFRAALSTKSKD